MSANKEEEEEDDTFFQLSEDEEKRLSKTITERIKNEREKQTKIKENICEIDYKYAESNQTPQQKQDMAKYIKNGMEINAYIRDPLKMKNYKEMTKDIDKQLSKSKGIMTKETFVGKYYIVYRCLIESNPDKFKTKTEWFMSTSNEKITGFGSSCLRIFVPIETPVLVGNISDNVSSENTYEIVLPRNTELISMGGHNKEFYYGDFYVKNKTNGGGGRKRKRRTGPRKTSHVHTRAHTKRRQKRHKPLKTLKAYKKARK